MLGSNVCLYSSLALLTDVILFLVFRFRYQVHMFMPLPYSSSSRELSRHFDQQKNVIPATPSTLAMVWICDFFLDIAVPRGATLALEEHYDLVAKGLAWLQRTAMVTWYNGFLATTLLEAATSQLHKMVIIVDSNLLLPECCLD